MEDKEKPIQKQHNILIIILTLILCFTVIAITYAYIEYTGNNYNTGNVNMSVGELSLVYTDCADGYDHCKDISASLKPGDSVVKTFKVQNDGSAGAYFLVKFASVTNTFINNELVYTLEDITDTSNIITEKTTTPVPTSVDVIKSGLYIAKNTTKSYRLTITFINQVTDQGYNAEAEFLLTLGIESDDDANALIDYTE